MLQIEINLEMLGPCATPDLLTAAVDWLNAHNTLALDFVITDLNLTADFDRETRESVDALWDEMLEKCAALM